MFKFILLNWKYVLATVNINRRVFDREEKENLNAIDTHKFI